jgi:hypothetical protein
MSTLARYHWSEPAKALASGFQIADTRCFPEESCPTAATTSTCVGYVIAHVTVLVTPYTHGAAKNLPCVYRTVLPLVCPLTICSRVLTWVSVPSVLQMSRKEKLVAATCVCRLAGTTLVLSCTSGEP